MWTALIVAAKEGHRDVVRFLVNDDKADVNAKDKYGWTALIGAAKEGHYDIVRFLVNDGGADVNIKNNKGWTALMGAAKEGHPADRGHDDIVRLLTPFVLPDGQSSNSDTVQTVGHNLLGFDRSPSCFISPSEVELSKFCEQGNIGGNFQAKWLDADAVVKLFIPDASHSTFEQEAHVWQQLRHPNVLKLYGVCKAGRAVNFFVCEYASHGSRELVWRMCCQNPHQRASLSSIVYELERLSIDESSDSSHTELEPTNSLDDYLSGEAKELWVSLQTHINKCDNVGHWKLFDKLEHVYNRLRESEQSERLLGQFYSLLIDTYRTVKMTPEETQALRLTSTRATRTSMYSFNWRVDALLKALGESTSEDMETLGQQQRCEQSTAFVSGITDIVLLLQSLKSVEEKAAFLRTLKAEVENPQDKYTEEQLDVIKKTCKEIENKLEGKGDVAKFTPDWFIPWYELILDRGAHLGAGGDAVKSSDLHTKIEVNVGDPTMDDEVCIKEGGSLFAEDVEDQMDVIPEVTPTTDEVKVDRAMFCREADIWFGLSHPHVVRLFGACHIVKPFFVCEPPTCGTLDNYLRQHPDELWIKLHEAALGVQYLHARDVVHGHE
ncbi:Serine/threonine protein Kinase [Phytophthora palmivora]|uniref:Serine/threonine protein Kinase n=1 Tax=Phytophthora palmivora TaxID=4796 RepID=A0A2P4YSK1_9STRA|nr:Serine/threonine protein Kinase [Phytophthora palmivora]